MAIRATNFSSDTISSYYSENASSEHNATKFSAKQEAHYGWESFDTIDFTKKIFDDPTRKLGPDQIAAMIEETNKAKTQGTPAPRTHIIQKLCYDLALLWDLFTANRTQKENQEQTLKEKTDALFKEKQSESELRKEQFNAQKTLNELAEKKKTTEKVSFFLAIASILGVVAAIATVVITKGKAFQAAIAAFNGVVGLATGGSKIVETNCQVNMGELQGKMAGLKAGSTASRTKFEDLLEDTKKESQEIGNLDIGLSKALSNAHKAAQAISN